MASLGPQPDADATTTVMRGELGEEQAVIEERLACGCSRRAFKVIADIAEMLFPVSLPDTLGIKASAFSTWRSLAVRTLALVTTIVLAVVGNAGPIAYRAVSFCILWTGALTVGVSYAQAALRDLLYKEKTDTLNGDSRESLRSSCASVKESSSISRVRKAVRCTSPLWHISASTRNLDTVHRMLPTDQWPRGSESSLSRLAATYILPAMQIIAVAYSPVSPFADSSDRDVLGRRPRNALDHVRRVSFKATSILGGAYSNVAQFFDVVYTFSWSLLNFLAQMYFLITCYGSGHEASIPWIRDKLLYFFQKFPLFATAFDVLLIPIFQSWARDVTCRRARHGNNVVWSGYEDSSAKDADQAPHAYRSDDTRCWTVRTQPVVWVGQQWCFAFISLVSFAQSGYLMFSIVRFQSTQKNEIHLIKPFCLAYNLLYRVLVATVSQWYTVLHPRTSYFVLSVLSVVELMLHLCLRPWLVPRANVVSAGTRAVCCLTLIVAFFASILPVAAKMTLFVIMLSLSIPVFLLTAKLAARWHRVSDDDKGPEIDSPYGYPEGGAAEEEEKDDSDSLARPWTEAKALWYSSLAEVSDPFIRGIFLRNVLPNNDDRMSGHVGELVSCIRGSRFVPCICISLLRCSQSFTRMFQHLAYVKCKKCCDNGDVFKMKVMKRHECYVSILAQHVDEREVAVIKDALVQASEDKRIRFAGCQRYLVAGACFVMITFQFACLLMGIIPDHSDHHKAKVRGFYIFLLCLAAGCMAICVGVFLLDVRKDRNFSVQLHSNATETSGIRREETEGEDKGISVRPCLGLEEKKHDNEDSIRSVNPCRELTDNQDDSDDRAYKAPTERNPACNILQYRLLLQALVTVALLFTSLRLYSFMAQS